MEELKMEGSLFWEAKRQEDFSQEALDFDHKKEDFSRVYSNLSQQSYAPKKPPLPLDFPITAPHEKNTARRSTVRGDTQEEASILNQNIVEHVNFNIPEPSIEQEVHAAYRSGFDKTLLEQKFENKCKKISQEKDRYATNFFSFHEMKPDLNTRRRRNLPSTGVMPIIQDTQTKKNCFYTNLFLKSNQNLKKEIKKPHILKQKKHVNLSTLNIKKDSSINNCKITGSRRGSRRDLNEVLPSVYSTQYPYTDPRKNDLIRLQIPKNIFLKLNQFRRESPLESFGKKPQQMILTGERKVQRPIQLNPPLTPNIRFIKLDPTNFQTPETQRNLNLVLNSLKKLQGTPQQKFFPKSKTMLDLQAEYNPKKIESKSKTKPKGNKMSTPKVKRKVIKKKSKGTSKKKKNGCRCKKTHCTRLHCICFREKSYCDESCSCNNCYNQEKFKNMITHIRELTEEINPLAFKSKIQVIETKSGQKIHNRGCSCTKNNCKKNYCECFKNNLPCSPLCKCENCKNEHVKLEAEEVKKIFKKCSRKKKKFVIEIGEKNPEVHNIQMT
jgi:hypothetical protein